MWLHILNYVCVSAKYTQAKFKHRKKTNVEKKIYGFIDENQKCEANKWSVLNITFQNESRTKIYFLFSLKKIHTIFFQK